jgi:MFS family permease
VLRLTGGPRLYAVTAVMHLISSVLILRLRVRESPSQESVRAPFCASMRTGLTFMARHPVLRTFTLGNAATNLGAGVFMTVVPLFVFRDLRITAPTYALVVSVGSTGGIAGSLIAMRIRGAVGEVRTKVLAGCLLPLAFAAMPLAGVAGLPLLVLGVSEFFFGLILTVASISSTGVRAKVTPSHLMGRVAAASRFVTQGVIPLGALLAGVVTTHAGDRAGLWLATGIASLGGLLLLASPIRSMRDVPHDDCDEGVALKGASSIAATA